MQFIITVIYTGPGTIYVCLYVYAGLGTIQRRRGLETEKPVLLTGPGKVVYTLHTSISFKIFFCLLHWFTSLQSIRRDS